MPNTPYNPTYRPPFNSPQPVRRGSISERRMKCGKPDCACHADPAKRHGPYFSLTRGIGAKTKSRYLSDEEIDIARRQVAHGDLLRDDYERYWQACESLADTELLHARPQESPGTDEKKGAAHGKRLRRSSRRKSTN